MLSNKKILITGINSHLAKKISKSLKQKNFILYGITSTKIYNKNYYSEIGKIDNYNFLMKIVPRCNFILHMGWDRNFSKNQNLNLLKKILKIKKKNAKIIFFSSVAASPNAKSYYGKMKFKVSQFIKKTNNINLFIGLVDHKNSSQLKLLNKIFNSKFFKIRFSKNVFNVYYVKINSLIKVILNILYYTNNKKNYLVVDKVFPINEFLDYHNNEKKITIYIPFFIYKFLIKIIYKINLKNFFLDKIKTFSFKDDNFLKNL